MLTILLKSLSILGISLLCLLGLTVVIVLLVLFLPVAYRLEASRSLSENKIKVKANWLFGIFRLRYLYPDPGKATVKALWFSLVRDKDKRSGKKKKREKKRKRPAKKSVGKDAKEGQSESGQTQRTENAQTQENQTADSRATGSQTTDTQHGTAEGTSEEKKEGPLSKIKCTFQRICGKIKEICDNIDFYREILLCDDTRGLVDHAFRRLGKILKNIRPRKLRADICFGTGSPDTTGYALGVYGMLSPHLGRHVNVTPDFTQAVLEGEVRASGHITVFQLLRHGGMLILDKRLRQLRQKLKERETTEQKSK